jgi:hypothetical protein
MNNHTDLKDLILATITLAMLASTLPLNSQAVPAAQQVRTPEAMLAELKVANEQLLQKQAETMQKLDEIGKNAQQLRAIVFRL